MYMYIHGIWTYRLLSLSLSVFISRGLFPMHYNYVGFLYDYYSLLASCMAPGIAWFCSVCATPCAISVVYAMLPGTCYYSL